MENASDALIMAGQVLIFIIALTVCISSFSNVRLEVDSMISQTETIKFAKGSEGYINYIESDENSAIRKVGVETIVSSMYRASKENYNIYIKLQDYSGLAESADNDKNVEFYDATKDLMLNKNGVTKTLIKINDRLIKVGIGNNKNQKINLKLRNGLYDKIKNLNFYEYFGQYQNDSQANSTDRITYRIITYIDSRCLDEE